MCVFTQRISCYEWNAAPPSSGLHTSKHWRNASTSIIMTELFSCLRPPQSSQEVNSTASFRRATAQFINHSQGPRWECVRLSGKHQINCRLCMFVWKHFRYSFQRLSWTAFIGVSWFIPSTGRRFIEGHTQHVGCGSIRLRPECCDTASRTKHTIVYIVILFAFCFVCFVFFSQLAK